MKVVRLLVLAATATTSCSPGEVDPSIRSDAEAPPADGPPRPALSGSTPLEGCAKFPTLVAFEQQLVVPRCGTAGCHDVNGRPFAPDMKVLPIYPRLLDRKTTACEKKDLYVDSRASAEQSYLVSKVRDVRPTCSDGRPGGARMPFGVKEPLADDEIACFVSYVRALVGR